MLRIVLPVTGGGWLACLLALMVSGEWIYLAGLIVIGGFFVGVHYLPSGPADCASVARLVKALEDRVRDLELSRGFR